MYLLAVVTSCLVAFTYGAIGPMSPTDQALVLKLHNDYRAKEPAAVMPALVWNASLAASAQAWANDCVFEHQPTETTTWGENIAAGTVTAHIDNSDAITQGFNNWVSESKFNTDGAFSCCTMAGFSCCHLTQVVWAKSTSVGCAVSHCGVLRDKLNGAMDNAYYLACYYNPPGNNPEWLGGSNFDWSPYKKN